MSQAPQQRKSIAKIGAQRVTGMNRVVSMEGTDLFGMSPLEKDTPQSGGDFDVDVVDLSAAADGHNSDGDGLTPTTTFHRAGKQIGSSISSSIRPSPGAANNYGSGNRSLSGGKRCKVANAEPRTPDASSKGSPRYTTADALRNSVRRMKL